MKNRIRELRQARGWSMEHLGELLGKKSISAIARLEKAEADLIVEDLIAAANVFHVSWEEVVGYEPPIVEDAISVDPAQASADFRLMPHDDEAYYTVQTPVLDALGVEVGDLIIVDRSSEAFERLQSLDAVVITVQQGKKATTLLRQFIEPDLFVTNSKGANPAPINRKLTEVTIRGTIVRRIAPVGRSSGSNGSSTTAEKR